MLMMFNRQLMIARDDECGGGSAAVFRGIYVLAKSMKGRNMLSIGDLTAGAKVLGLLRVGFANGGGVG